MKNLVKGSVLFLALTVSTIVSTKGIYPNVLNTLLQPENVAYDNLETAEVYVAEQDIKDENEEKTAVTLTEQETATPKPTASAEPERSNKRYTNSDDRDSSYYIRSNNCNTEIDNSVSYKSSKSNSTYSSSAFSSKRSNTGRSNYRYNGTGSNTKYTNYQNKHDGEEKDFEVCIDDDYAFDFEDEFDQVDDDLDEDEYDSYFDEIEEAYDDYFDETEEEYEDYFEETEEEYDYEEDLVENDKVEAKLDVFKIEIIKHNPMDLEIDIAAAGKADKDAGDDEKIGFYNLSGDYLGTSLDKNTRTFEIHNPEGYYSFSIYVDPTNYEMSNMDLYGVEVTIFKNGKFFEHLDIDEDDEYMNRYYTGFWAFEFALDNGKITCIG